jgi:hypothetical protein
MNNRRKRLQRREIVFLKLGANVRVRKTDFPQWCEERTVKGSNGVDSSGEIAK